MLRDSAACVVKTNLSRGDADRPDLEDLRQKVEQMSRRSWRKVYLDALMDMEVSAGGPLRVWKHGIATWQSDYATRDIKVVFTVRNPYSWFLALARRPYHRRGLAAHSLIEFADHPWMTLERDGLDRVLDHPMVLWNAKTASYGPFREAAAAAGLTTAQITFEEFVADPVATVTEVMTVLDIPIGQIAPLEMSTKEDARPLSQITEYYRTERWKRWLTRDLVALLTDRIDWQVAAQYGYQPLDPQDFPQSLDARTAIEIAKAVPWLGQIDPD